MAFRGCNFDLNFQLFYDSWFDLKSQSSPSSSPSHVCSNKSFAMHLEQRQCVNETKKANSTYSNSTRLELQKHDQ